MRKKNMDEKEILRGKVQHPEFKHTQREIQKIYPGKRVSLWANELLRRSRKSRENRI